MNIAWTAVEGLGVAISCLEHPAPADVAIEGVSLQFNTEIQILVGQQRSKINALVSETDAGCKVVLNLAMEQASGFGFSSTSMTEDQAKEYYNDLFDKIESRL